MKIRILLCIAILLIVDVQAQDSAKLVPRPKSKGEYIILKDSTKLTGNVWMAGGKKGGVKLDGQLYELDQLLGYKEDNDYHVIMGDGVYQVLALGKIQAYFQWGYYVQAPSYNPGAPIGNRMEFHSRRTTSCYLRKDTGRLMPCITQFLFDMISDNEEAVKEFYKRFKKISNSIRTDLLYANLPKVLAVYNGGLYTQY